MSHAKVDHEQDLIAFAKTGAPPARPSNYETRHPSDCICVDAPNHANGCPAGADKGPTIVTNLRCPKHGSYTGTFGNLNCPYCRSVPRYPAPIALAVEGNTSDAPEKMVKADCLDCANSICDECVPGVKKIGAVLPAAQPKSLTAFAAEVHRDNAHWWHDPATGAKLTRNMGEMLMLVISEIAECMEGERKNLMDDKLPHRKMAEVELADAIIRLADIMGSRNCDVDAYVASWFARYDDLNDPFPTNKGEALYAICDTLSMGRTLRLRLTDCFFSVIEYAEHHGYDLWGAVHEKRIYNAVRADHKPEARLAPGGKKW